MEGLVIIILTLLAIAAFIFLVWASEKGLEALNALYNDTGEDEHQAAKVFLLIPYILLFIWVLLLKILLFAGAFMAVISLANSARDWWHKAPRGP